MTNLAQVLADTQTNINTILASQKTAAEAYATSSRKRTYEIAQHLIIFGRELFKEGNESAYLQLLKTHGISTSVGTNPWHYVVKMVMGDDKTWLNRTGALRALNKWSSEKQDAKIAAFIDTFTLQAVKKRTQDIALQDAIGKSSAARMDGLAQLDRLEHRDKNAKTDDELVAEAVKVEALDLSEVQVSNPETKLVLIWASVKDGIATPRGIVKDSERDARRAAISAAKNPGVAPQAVTEAILAKKGDFVFGDEVGSTTAPMELVAAPTELAAEKVASE